MNWMWLPDEQKTSDVGLFRCVFEADGKTDTEFEYSADEDCQLFIDGALTAPGPEIGAPERWYFARLRKRLAPGKHILVARVWCFGKKYKAALAYQLSVRPGFYCTLKGEWCCRTYTGVSFAVPWPDWGGFPRFKAQIACRPEWLAGGGDGWCEPSRFEDARPLFPPELPEGRKDECRAFRREKDKIVFNEYVCVRGEYTFSGHGMIRMRWSETPYLTSSFSRHNLKGEKGRRDGKYFVGDFDTIEVNGPVHWFDFLWRAGRYLEIQCTGSAKLEKVRFFHSGYKYPEIAFPRGKWKKILEMAKRTLECCSHTTLMDCPFYERMQYISDARCEALALYALEGDPALIRKALRLTALSQKENGMLASRYPCKVDSEIPSFVPAWLIMLYDYWKHTQDVALVHELLPTARKISELFCNSRRKDGLVYLDGWGFIDWQWPLRGVPYGSENGTNSIVNLLVVLAWQKLSELEACCRNTAEAGICRKNADELLANVWNTYFDVSSCRMADDPQRQFFSEHAQVLTMLAKHEPSLLTALRKGEFHTKCGIYFASYYMEACEAYGEKKLLQARLEEYLQLQELGLSTLPETFTAPRSDCHAWGAHILFHYRQFQGKPYKRGDEKRIKRLV